MRSANAPVELHGVRPYDRSMENTDSLSGPPILRRPWRRCKPASQCWRKLTELQQHSRTRNKVRDQRAKVGVGYTLHICARRVSHKLVNCAMCNREDDRPVHVRKSPSIACPPAEVVASHGGKSWNAQPAAHMAIQQTGQLTCRNCTATELGHSARRT